tara:strand:- start:720 stop:962 length:243 start_codon:yes stop_codon:yes gene_type:complete
MSIRKLKKELEQTKQELYELHYGTPSPDVYRERRSDLEYQIVCLEEMIELEKAFIPFRLTLFGFVVIVASMLLWLYVRKY